jgi:multidrug efflux pump
MYGRQVYGILSDYPETEHVFQIDAPGISIAGAAFRPWDERTRTAGVLQPQMQQAVDGIAGVQAAAFQPPPLPGSQGLPVQFVIATTEPFSQLNPVAEQFLQEAIKSGMFIFLDTDLKIDAPQATVEIDRDKAAQLGLRMSDIGGAMGWMRAAAV